MKKCFIVERLKGLIEYCNSIKEAHELDNNDEAVLEYEFDIQALEEVLSMEDFADVKRTQAQSLPEGWIWTEYDDGSGCIKSPDDVKYFSYDLNTKEYQSPTDQHYIYFPGMNLKSLKPFAEKYISENILSGRL